ncbi:MAG: PASTA domain-containing protein [Bacilli bacterium]|nr:PASTA domain-containing protein [Bacilli bacterium]
MSRKNKRDLINEESIKEEETIATDFLDAKSSKKRKKTNKKQNHEIDLNTYIPEHFEKEKNKKQEVPKVEQKDDSFITDVTMPIPKIDVKEPEIENLFVNKAKEYKKEEEPIQEKKTRSKSPKGSAPLSFLFTLMLVSAFAYMGYALFFGDAQIKQTEFLINSIILLLITFCMITSYKAEKVKKRKVFAFLESILMTGFFVFNILSATSILILPQNTVMKDFTGKSIEEALKWAEANRVTVEQEYDDSDTTEEYHIIKQSVYPNVLASSIKKVTFTVSSGPDYNKEVILMNLIGRNIDDVIKTIDENYLNNVTVDFETNDDIEQDIIIKQSKSGQMKRNDEIKFNVSFGKEAPTEELSMEKLQNLTEFKATLWLKRNNIKYSINRDFSNTVKKGTVIKQSKKADDKIKPNDENVELTISKGKKIVVPDLLNMSQKDITKWIIANRLKIEFEDRYDTKIKLGKVINANYNKNDEIEEGTTIKITLSKGQLKLPKFDSVDDFRSWATKYGVSYREEYVVNKDVEKGKMIRLSAEAGDILNANETIIIYISSGETIVVPNFIGQNKEEIKKSCSTMKLNCTFYYAGLSSKDKDTALSQNKRAGSEVEKDTYVDIGLSSGKQTSTPGVNTSPNKPNTGGGTTNPTPTPTPIPNCNTRSFYIQPDHIAIDNPEKTCSNIKSAYSGYNISCNYMESNSGRKGQVLNSSSLNGTTISSCKTVTVNIKSN